MALCEKDDASLKTNYVSPQYSTQHTLLRFAKCTKRALDHAEAAGTVSVLMDLSEAFNCINHDLLIAKLGAYGFGIGALTLIHDYLHGRCQREK